MRRTCDLCGKPAPKGITVQFVENGQQHVRFGHPRCMRRYGFAMPAIHQQDTDRAGGRG